MATLMSLRKRMESRWQLWLFLTVVFTVNLILGINRALQFEGMMNVDGSEPNIFYMISRACGESSKNYKLAGENFEIMILSRSMFAV